MISDQEVFPKPFDDYIIRKGEGRLDVLFENQKDDFSWMSQAEELMELVIDNNGGIVVSAKIVDNEGPWGKALIYFNDPEEDVLRFHTLKLIVKEETHGGTVEVPVGFNVGQEMKSHRLKKIEVAGLQPHGVGDIPKIVRQEDTGNYILVWVE